MYEDSKAPSDSLGAADLSAGDGVSQSLPKKWSSVFMNMGGRDLAPETALFAHGEREVDMFVVLEGELEIYSQDEKNERKLLATIGERQFTGELDLLSSRRTLVDGCTLTKCVLLRVPRAELRRLMRSEGDIANLIMQATIWRRLGIIEIVRPAIVLLGHSASAETIRLQRFLTRNAYPHRLLEPTAEQSVNADVGTPFRGRVSASGGYPSRR